MLRRVSFACIMLVPLYSSGQDSGETTAPVRSNLEQIREQAYRLVTEISTTIKDSGCTSVAVSIFPREQAWYIDQAVSRAITDAFLELRDSSSCAIELGQNEVRVDYRNPRREGLFGPKVVDRVVSVSLSVRVRAGTGTVLASEALRGTLADKIPVSAIERVESPTLAFTHGTMDPEGLGGGLLEPLVILGAIGIAVFLLFSVRS